MNISWIRNTWPSRRNEILRRSKWQFNRSASQNFLIFNIKEYILQKLSYGIFYRNGINHYLKVFFREVLFYPQFRSVQIGLCFCRGTKFACWKPNLASASSRLIVADVWTITLGLISIFKSAIAKLMASVPVAVNRFSLPRTAGIFFSKASTTHLFPVAIH